jgi:hypothetical protein
LTPSTTYFYRVRAYNTGNSGYSNVASAATQAAPAAPSGLAATPVSTVQIALSWTDNADNETGFRIERSADGVTYAQVGSVGAEVTTYTAAGLAPATKYWFRVRGYNASNGAYSEPASATTLTAPAAPSDLAAAPISTSQLRLTWTDNSDNENGFRIERSPDGVTFA